MRQTLLFEPPCLQLCHSPSPSTLMPVLSTSMCSGPLEPRHGMLTSKVFWRRDRVMKSGTGQFNPDKSSRLAMNPVAWRSGNPSRTLRVRQASIAASLAGGRDARTARFPLHRGIEPDGQRAALPKHLIVALPTGRLVRRLRRSAHATQLACWIQKMNPAPPEPVVHPRIPLPCAARALRGTEGEGAGNAWFEPMRTAVFAGICVLHRTSLRKLKHGPAIPWLGPLQMSVRRLANVDHAITSPRLPASRSDPA